MPIWLIVYLSILGVCTLEIVIEYAAYDCSKDCRGPKFKRFVYTPKDIYNRTYMNWFGCIYCYILLILFTPHLLLLKWTIPPLMKFSYWIFHAGRCGNCKKCKYWKIERIPNGVHKVCTKSKRKKEDE